MGIGVGIFLIALGAILAFAVDWHLSGLDLHVVGLILILVGIAGIILYFVFWNNRRAARGTVATRPLGARGPATYTETSTYREPAVYTDAPPPPPDL
jgi:hypothetical protein